MTAAARPAPSDIDAVRAALAGRYDVLSEVGRGGMAHVYRARDVELEREVALKVLPASLAFDAEFVERFLREARTAGQLQHPHIVPIHQVGRAGPVIYFVMQLLAGPSLGARLRERGRLAPAELRRVLLETAGALGYAHRRGVVHRDVKPDNILFDEEGRCMVTDFGIARSAADQRLTAPGLSLGTPRYMSPEQARAHPVDGRSDLYSLGVVAYECLAGHTPFGGDDPFAILLGHVNEPVPRPPLATADERALYAVVERMLAKSPDGRFQTADALAAALGGTGAHVAHTPAGAAGPARAPRAVESGREPRIPASAPALDAALDAALSVGMRIVQEQRPKVSAAARAAARGAEALARGGAALAGACWRAWRARPARPADPGPRAARDAALVIGAAALTFGGGYYLTHLALTHRSRCPDAARAGAPVTVLVDPVDPVRAGATLGVYYDVCGMARGTGYTAQLAVRQGTPALPWLKRGTDRSRLARFYDRASGPATRRHERISLAALPAGRYTLELLVLDAGGTLRAARTPLEIRAQ